MNSKYKAGILLLFLMLKYPIILFSQENLLIHYIPISFNEFLSNVSKGNLGYVAEQFNVSISEAQLEASKVFPDPEISLAYSNNQDNKLMMGQSLDGGISYPVNFGNKRGAGISLSRSEFELSKMVLDAYFQNLRADAARSYFSALKNQEHNLLQKDINNQLVKLARTDSIRLISGEANSLDAMQSSLEARAQLSTVYQSRSDMQNSFIELMHIQGKESSDTLNIPSDEFSYAPRIFIISDLVQSALKNRADLMVAIRNKEVSEKTLHLLRANRAFEVSFEAGYSYNSVVENQISPAPAYNAITAGVSIPIKFSSLNRGAMRAAELAVNQSETMNKEVENRILSDVFEAYNNFIVQSQKVELFKSGIITDAEKILQGRIYSYQHGETGLVDVLNAQKTYIELKKNYIEVLFDYSCSLIDLEWAAGIWDIKL